jgi:multidrug efflux pump subunit AcrA (membrane-fusion protein)
VKRALRWFVTLALLAGIGYGGWYGLTRYQQQDKPAQVALAQVRFGEFLEVIRCRGEVKADRSVQVYVPFIPNLRIAWMAPAGEPVQAGDTVVRYETTNGEQDRISAEASLEQVQAQFEQAKAQNTITSEHDDADVVDGNFQVELAKIKTATNEFVGRLEAERNTIDLTVAEQKLRQLEASVNQHRVANAAKMKSLERQRDFQKLYVDLVKDRMKNLEVKAPVNGYWIVNQNYQGTSSQPFKVGDNVNAGLNLAVIPDMSSLMMDVKVEEIDRGRITLGMDVLVRVDAVPDLVVRGKLTRISPLAELSLEDTIARNFRGYSALGTPDARIRPGMNGGMDIVINRIPETVTVPAKALFTKAGKPVVYVSEGGQLRRVDVEVLARNPDEIAVKGIDKGAMVALVDPEANGDKGKEPAGK